MNDLKDRLKLILFLIVLFMLSSYLAGDDIVIKVAFAEWPPWKMTTGDSIGGIDAEILYAIEDHSDFKFEFVVAPWKRCSGMLKLGQVDMITSYGESDERLEFADFINPPYTTGHIKFYYLNNEKFEINEYDDLHGKRLGCISGSSYIEHFASDKELDMEFVQYEKQTVDMLLAYRIDVIIAWEVAMDFELAKSGKDQIIKKSSYCPCTKHAADWKKELEHSHLAFSKKSDKLKYKIEISEILISMLENGEIDKIVADFINSQEERK